MTTDIHKNAIISGCGQYRYVLVRDWDLLLPARTMTFVMLNPSTADDVDDDPTIRRCIHFARREGCNRLRPFVRGKQCLKP